MLLFITGISLINLWILNIHTIYQLANACITIWEIDNKLFQFKT